MLNWMVTGIIGIATVAGCFIIARVTGNEKKTRAGGIFAILSAGGFGYAIASMVEKGLTGPYLVVAALVAIIVPVLIFLTIYNLVKEPSSKESMEKKAISKKVEEISREEESLQKQKESLSEMMKRVKDGQKRLEKEQEIMQVERVKIKEIQIRLEESEAHYSAMETRYQSQIQALKEERDNRRSVREIEYEKQLQILQEAYTAEKAGIYKAHEEEIAEVREAARAEAETAAVQDKEAIIFEKEQLLEERRQLAQEQAELLKEREMLMQEIESLRQEEAEKQRVQKLAEQERQSEATRINRKAIESFDYSNVIEKAKNLQKQGIHDMAILLYQDCLEKLEGERDRQIIEAALADCYIDAGEPGKAKKILAKR